MFAEKTATPDSSANARTSAAIFTSNANTVANLSVQTQWETCAETIEEWVGTNSGFGFGLALSMTAAAMTCFLCNGPRPIPAANRANGVEKKTVRGKEESETGKKQKDETTRNKNRHQRDKETHRDKERQGVTQKDKDRQRETTTERDTHDRNLVHICKQFFSLVKCVWTGGREESDIPRKVKRASKEPSVLLWTHTPFPLRSTLESTDSISCCTCCFNASRSSRAPQTNTGDPGTQSSYHCIMHLSLYHTENIPLSNLPSLERRFSHRSHPWPSCDVHIPSWSAVPPAVVVSKVHECL